MTTSLSEAELTELIWLIEDKPVNEDFLKGIRTKLAHRRKLLRKILREST